MTIALAIEFIPIRMKEYGISEYGEQYHHFVIQPSKTKIIEGFNHFWFLMDENPNISITSYSGDYDLSNPAIDEQTYEHQGLIVITNNGSSPANIRFMQIIPNENNIK